MPTKFSTTLRKSAEKDVVGIVVPEDAILELDGGKRPSVVVTVNNYTYRSTVGTMNGLFMIPFSSEHRAATGYNGGELVEITLDLDLQPRVTATPADLQSALVIAGKAEAFDALAPSRKKEFVRQVEEAKTEETRLRRISKVLDSIVVKPS